MAEATLRRLQQWQGTVTSYAACFHLLRGDRECNEVLQLYQHQWGLQEEIKDELAHIEMPMGLDAFVDLAHHIHEWL